MPMMTPERLIKVVRFCSTINGCWPPPPNASKKSVRRREMWWLFSMVFAVHGMVQCFQGIIRNPENPVKITKTVTEAGKNLPSDRKQALQTYLLGPTENKLFLVMNTSQAVDAALEEYLAKNNRHEREVIQSCISRCTPLYLMLGVSAIAALIAFATTPLYIEGLVKVTEISYIVPCEDTRIMTVLIYLSEVVSAAIAASAAFVDMEMSIFLWYFGARFQVLGDKFSEASTDQEFRNCIIEHQTVLEFSQNIVVPTRRIAVLVAGVLVFGSICSAYQLVSDEPLVIKVRFVLLLFAIALGMLMYSWPSDYLKTTSTNVAIAVFYSRWIDRSQATRNTISLVIMRAQKAVVMKINGFLAELDMVFFATYLTTSFTYFATLRAVTS